MKKFIFVIALFLFSGALFGQLGQLVNDLKNEGYVPELESIELTDGKLTLTLSQYVQNPQAEEGETAHAYTLRWKEVYGAKDGKVILEKIYEGNYRSINVSVEQEELYYEVSE